MDMDTGPVILTRGLPKTGQTFTRLNGDDGFYQAGWWRGLLIAANRTRFVKDEYTGGVSCTIDRATGLMWATSADDAGCNNDASINLDDALAYAEGLDFAGFTDWRLPNIKELLSIVDYEQLNPMIDRDFFTCANALYWTSTNHPTTDDKAYYVSFADGLVDFGDGIFGVFEDIKMRCVRNGL